MHSQPKLLAILVLVPACGTPQTPAPAAAPAPAMAAAPARPALAPCSFSPPPGGMAQGIGEGNAVATARTAALGDLCQVLRSEVSSLVELKASAVTRGATHREDSSEEIVQTVNALRSNCVFEDLPLTEARNEVVDGRVCMVLRLSVRGYYDYLERRRCVLVFESPGEADLDGSDLLSSVLPEIRARGLIPVDPTTKDARFEAKVIFTVDAVAAGVGGLINGRGHVRFLIRDRTNGALMTDEQLETGPVRAFDKSGLSSAVKSEAKSILADRINARTKAVRR
jgi:hypothetical protein